MASACVDLPAPLGPAKMTTRGERFDLVFIVHAMLLRLGFSG